MTPPLTDPRDCCRETLGVGGWLCLKFGLDVAGLSSVRVATPGVCMMDRLRIGMYRDRSKSASLRIVLSGPARLLDSHAASVATAFSSSGNVEFCSRLYSSGKFNNLFAS
jgi:hypothetical protein